MPHPSDEEIERLLSGKGYKTQVKNQGWFDQRAVTRFAAEIQGTGLTVGIHEDLPDVVERAMYNEFGTKTIPSRPFFRSTLDRRAKAYDQKMLDLMDDAFRGKVCALDGLLKFGKGIVRDIRSTIDRWKFPRNSPATIKRKGFDQPLIETGEMRDSLEARITKGAS